MNMKAKSDIAVVHLVRAGNPLEVLKRFLDSYLLRPSGVDHNLTFLLKGFGAKLPKDVSELLDSAPHNRVYCPDKGYDVGSYFYAAERLFEPFMLFTNSFSVLHGDDWLSKFRNAYDRPGVGLVGATGSWESITIDSPGDRLLAAATAIVVTPLLRVLFPPFPNAHVRTNGFFLARSDFLHMRPRHMRTKLDAWRFESGRSSMTRQTLRRGMGVLVVGKDGSVYRPEQWSESRTFWQSKQENLLIHDNRTMAYERGSADFQAKKFRSAWNFVSR